MSSSVIQQTKRGAGVRSENKVGTAVTFQLGDPDLRQRYNLMVLDISIASAENNVTMSTLGNDIYMYTTGDKPERITLSGVTCYDACSESDGTSDPLMELYSQSKSGTLKSWFKMLLNGITYRVYLIKCTRNVSSVQEDLDTFRLELVGVRA